MTLHRIKKGLDLPVAGEPQQTIDGEGPKVTRVAIVADDYPGMKPKMFVKEGDTVKRGQVLFEDRKNPGVLFTAPGAGKVIGVNRGDKRALQSVVVHLSEAEVAGQGDTESVMFDSYKGTDPAGLSREDVVALLVESGLWTALRKRPFSKVPAVDGTPFALFVNAMDTNPLAANPDLAIEPRKADFDAGLTVLSKLTEGTTYLCTAPGSKAASGLSSKVQTEEFSGPHPAGTTGLHMHTLAPVSRKRECWGIGYQDVIAVGHLFKTGKLDVSRVVSIGGPQLKQPRIVNTRLGAFLDDLVTKDDVKPAPDGQPLGDNDFRVISGSVLSGKRAVNQIFGFLGRYHVQVSVLREGREREFLGWLAPGADKFSIIPTFISKFMGSKKFNFTTTTNGSPRAMVPIGMYEEIMPLDIMPTFLLRSLMVGDVEQAEKLGVLELDEEDVALCTFVCPGKTNYGPILRANLTTIEKDG